MPNGSGSNAAPSFSFEEDSMSRSIIVIAAVALMGSAALAETMEKTGKTASGDTCHVTVEKHSDGSITALGSSGSGTTGSTASSGSLASSILARGKFSTCCKVTGRRNSFVRV